MRGYSKQMWILVARKLFPFLMRELPMGSENCTAISCLKNGGLSRAKIHFLQEDYENQGSPVPWRQKIKICAGTEILKTVPENFCF